MTVYLVYFDKGDDNSYVCGVYRTREAAQKYIDHCAPWERSLLSIVEEVVLG